MRAPEPSSADPQRATRFTYAGFWRRFGGLWLDTLLIGGLALIANLIGYQLQLSPVIWLLPGLVITLFFNVCFVAWRGGTPAMLILNMRVALVDGAAVTLQAAALRYSVLFVLGVATAIGSLLGALAMAPEAYYSLGFLERSRQMRSLVPPWYSTASIALQCWVFSEFISMLFNKKRRAIQDFMAGRVVLHEPR